MNDYANSMEKFEADILTSDVPDEALERAASVGDGNAITIGYCTHWYWCSWPV